MFILEATILILIFLAIKIATLSHGLQMICNMQLNMREYHLVE